MQKLQKEVDRLEGNLSFLLPNKYIKPDIFPERDTYIIVVLVQFVATDTKVKVTCNNDIF